MKSRHVRHDGFITEHSHRGPPTSQHQTNLWQRLCTTWLRWAERRRRRGSYRDLADDPYLLKDLGLSREDLGVSYRETLIEAERRFWP